MPVAAVGEERAAPARRIELRRWHHARCSPEGHRRQGQRLFQRHPHVAGKLPPDQLRQPPHEGQVLPVQRPGRFRFDYARPSRQIVISDGQYLAVEDLDLNTEDRVELDQTPFRLILQSDVDLIRDAQIMEVQESDDLIVVALQDKNPDAGGQIKLFLATKPDLELKAWSTKDAQGIEPGWKSRTSPKTCQLDAELFKIAPVGWKE